VCVINELSLNPYYRYVLDIIIEVIERLRFYLYSEVLMENRENPMNWSGGNTKKGWVVSRKGLGCGEIGQNSLWDLKSEFLFGGGDKSGKNVMGEIIKKNGLWWFKSGEK